MTTTDQVLTAIVVGLAFCIVSLCWSLQQANHRLDELELEVYDDEDQAAEPTPVPVGTHGPITSSSLPLLQPVPLPPQPPAEDA